MNRALVIRFSSLGDIVLSSAVVGLLKERNPHSIIDFLVHERFGQLVTHFDPPPDNIIPFPPTIGALRLPRYAIDLAKNKYDLVIDLHDSLRSKLLRRFMRPMRLQVYRKPRMKRRLLFYGYINRFNSDFSVVSEYLRYAGLNATVEESRPRLAVSDDTTAQVRSKFGLSNKGTIACVPGAAWPQKTWLPERYIELFATLPEDAFASLALLGGPNDHICDTIASGLPAPKTINLKGKTDLTEALAILAGSHVVIGSDTGLLHAAEALNIPVLMILGPTSMETGARVLHTGSRVMQTDLWCRPCSQNGKRKCYRRQQYCITDITADMVIQEVTSMLDVS